MEYFRESIELARYAMLTVNDLQETNVLGVHNTVVSWIKSQPDPKQPVGTIINVNSGLAGLTIPKHSAYSVSKLASHKYMEYVAVGELDRCLESDKLEAWTIDLISLLDYPTLRPFTLLPGIVPTDMNSPDFRFFAQDDAEQTGALGLYLASSRADYLVNSLTSINWDLEEMEAHKDKISAGLLRNKWVSVLPVSGGNGL